jgi:phosphatidate cytidylyltransferase
MKAELGHRFFSPEQTLDHPVTPWLLGAIAFMVVVTWIGGFALHRAGRIADQPYEELKRRWLSWVILAFILLIPIVLGSGWVMGGVCLLSLLCYREYAWATGLFREKTISLFVVFGIFLVTFAVVDNFPRLFFASVPLTVGLIAIATIPQDRPKGYLQRVALGVLGFLLFGFCFGYLGYFANHRDYRVLLIFLILAVELNDVFAYGCGKLIGGPKVIPNTSPGKTWAGSIGALVLTTIFTMTLGHFIFRGTAMGAFLPLFIFGAGLSILGQFGDLLLSSIKRDAGIKDIGSMIPAHGGLLDRFDSLVLVPPAAFHFLSLYQGPIGLDQPQRILSGG